MEELVSDRVERDTLAESIYINLLEFQLSVYADNRFDELAEMAFDAADAFIRVAHIRRLSDEKS